jgi:hypothetical protein
MNIKTLIKVMEKFDPEEEILIAWWEKGLVEEWLEQSISNEVWSDIIAKVEESEYCWERVGNVLLDESKYLLEKG